MGFALFPEFFQHAVHQAAMQDGADAIGRGFQAFGAQAVTGKGTEGAQRLVFENGAAASCRVAPELAGLAGLWLALALFASPGQPPHLRWPPPPRRGGSV